MDVQEWAETAKEVLPEIIPDDMEQVYMHSQLDEDIIAREDENSVVLENYLDEKRPLIDPLETQVSINPSILFDSINDSLAP